MELMEAVNTRFSVRSFTDEPVTDEELNQILDAGRAAPSGKNNQPWRFVVVRNKNIANKIAEHTVYKDSVQQADVLVAVFVDPAVCYHHEKDMQGVGACIQNMWLAAHAQGVGMCWNGQIFGNADVGRLLDLDGDLELMAVLCLGRPAPDQAKRTGRLALDELVIKRIGAEG